jgi:hypothetical protein
MNGDELTVVDSPESDMVFLSARFKHSQIFGFRMWLLIMSLHYPRGRCWTDNRFGWLSVVFWSRDPFSPMSVDGSPFG